MPSPPLFDVEALLAPVPGSNPAGRSVPFEVRRQLDEARKEVNPADYAADDPMRPAEPVRADWPLIVRLTKKTLAETSKDLLIAARLTEALTKAHGYAGVRDGLTLLRRLIEACWDDLLPPIEEEEDIEARGSAFYWIDDDDRGARFPNAVRMIPLVSDGEASFGWLDWKRVQAEGTNESRAGLEKAVLATSRETCQNAVDDLTAALAELDGLGKALNDRMGTIAPGMVGLRQALGECRDLSAQVLSRKGAAPDVEPPDEVSPGTAVEGGEALAARGAPPPNTRKQVYRQIAAAAAALREIEPHSPIPYLLERAVELGAMPFPELMKVLVRDAGVLDAMNRELGIKGSEEG